MLPSLHSVTTTYEYDSKNISALLTDKDDSEIISNGVRFS